MLVDTSQEHEEVPGCISLADVLRLFRACCAADDAFATALVSVACWRALRELRPPFSDLGPVRFRTPLHACMCSVEKYQWACQQGLRASKMDCLVCAARIGALHVCTSLFSPELVSQAAATRPPAEVCRAAATGGHIDVIRWARAHGLAWDASCCAAAAFAGDLACLQWLRANGCPWDKNCSARASVEGHAAVLAWACENGCDYSEETVLRMKMMKLSLAMRAEAVPAAGEEFDAESGVTMVARHPVFAPS